MKYPDALQNSCRSWRRELTTQVDSQRGSLQKSPLFYAVSRGRIRMANLHGFGCSICHCFHCPYLPGPGALPSNRVLDLMAANCFVAKESWGLLIPLESPFCLELTSYLLRKGTIKRRKRGERTLRSTSSQMRCWQTQKNRQRRFCTLFLCPTERPLIRPSQSQSPFFTAASFFEAIILSQTFVAESGAGGAAV